MSRISDLHELIQHLNKRELRAVRGTLAAMTKGKPNQQSELFEALAQSKIPQSLQEITTFLSLPLQNNLPTILRRLRASIMNEVLMDSETKGIEGQLAWKLNEIRWLFDRNLLDQIPWTLKKAMKKAEQFELDNIAMELLSWERRLVEVKRHAVSSTYLEGLNQKENQFLQRYSQVIQLRQLKDEVQWYIQSKDETARPVQARLQEIIALPSLAAALSSPDKRRRMLALAIKGYCHRVLGQTEEAVERFESLLEEWEASPEWISEYPGAYMKDYNSFQAHALIGSNDLKSLEKHGQILLNLPIAHPKVRFRLTYYGFQQQLVVYMNFLEWELAEKVAVESEQWMRENWKLFDTPQKLAYLYNFAVLRFIRGHFSTAKVFLREIIALKAKTKRLDLRGAARMLYLAVNLAEEEYAYSDSLIKSAHIWFARNYDQWGFQRRFLGLAKRIVQAHSLQVPADFQLFIHEVRQAPLIAGANEVIIWAISRVSQLDMQKASEVRFAELRGGGR